VTKNDVKQLESVDPKNVNQLRDHWRRSQHTHQERDHFLQEPRDATLMV
jgi:hypothetical protein